MLQSPRTRRGARTLRRLRGEAVAQRRKLVGERGHRPRRGRHLQWTELSRDASMTYENMGSITKPIYTM